MINNIKIFSLIFLFTLNNSKMPTPDEDKSPAIEDAKEIVLFK